MDVPERHPTRTLARMSQTRSAGPGRPHAAAAPSQCHWCPPCRCPETPPDTLRARRPAKIHLRWQTAAGYVLIFKCLFQQLFQPFGIRLAVFYDRRPQVHSCTPCSFCFPVFLYYSTSSAFRGLPFAHKTARFAQAAAVDRNFFVCFRGCYDRNAGKVVELENEVTAVRIDFIAQYGYNIIRILLL